MKIPVELAKDYVPYNSKRDNFKERTRYDADSEKKYPKKRASRSKEKDTNTLKDD